MEKSVILMDPFTSEGDSQASFLEATNQIEPMSMTLQTADPLTSTVRTALPIVNRNSLATFVENEIVFPCKDCVNEKQDIFWGKLTETETMLSKKFSLDETEDTSENERVNSSRRSNNRLSRSFLPSTVKKMNTSRIPRFSALKKPPPQFMPTTPRWNIHPLACSTPLPTPQTKKKFKLT